jgi:excisionase family DNA binding protein
MYVTVKEYADFMNVAIPTVYTWIESGRIPKENIKNILNRILIKKERV